MGHDDLYEEAIKLLAKRDYARQELATRLGTLETDKDLVEAVVEDLVEQRYLDDRRVADNILSKELKKQYGPARLRQSLRQKGIEPEILEEVLATLEIDWLGMVSAIRQKKFGLLAPLDEKSKAKLVRHLQYRGHSMDMIREVVED